jgi:hypothetical protein
MDNMRGFTQSDSSGKAPSINDFTQGSSSPIDFTEGPDFAQGSAFMPAKQVATI